MDSYIRKQSLPLRVLSVLGAPIVFLFVVPPSGKVDGHHDELLTTSVGQL